MEKKVWAWDLETLDYFTAYFIDANDNEEKCFILGEDTNQIPELIKFLSSEVRGLIGFNSLNFDAQIIEYVMDNPNCSAKDIKNLADTIIKRKDEYESIPEWKLRHKHLDLYKVHHFDNKNRRTGLKWCQFMMDFPNIEDLSEEYDSVDQIISYNRNDVASTKELYERSRGMVNLRNNLTKLYSINFTNSSNSRIGSELLLKLYCNRAKLNPKEVRKLRTYRNGGIYLNDIIFPYISFENEIFNTFLKMLKTKIIYNTKGDFKYTIPFKGVKFEYGAGGIHASINGSLIEEDEEYMIIDSDVTSLYPSIAIENKMYPKHLGPIFTTVYKEDIVDVRKENKRLKEKGNSFIVEGFKEAANATYGKSNDQYSWLYDPQYTLQTTINGQLMITMLAEKLIKIPDSSFIQINTDGLTLRIPRKYESEYMKICEEWSKITRLELEHAYYKKMVIWDVNNYIAEYTNGKVKCKGRAEYENIPLHKNKSFSIIPRAVHDYFIKGIPVEDTIKSSTNIYEFCAGVKSSYNEKSGRSHYEIWSVNNGNFVKEKLSKIVRYFISKKGGTLLKIYERGGEEQVNAPYKDGKFQKDWRVTYFNKAYFPENFEDYNIDHLYYIHQAKTWINQIKNDKKGYIISLF